MPRTVLSGWTVAASLNTIRCADCLRTKNPGGNLKIRYLVAICLLLVLIQRIRLRNHRALVVRHEMLPVERGWTKVYSKNPEANDLYIQGLEYLNKGKPWAWRISGERQGGAEIFPARPRKKDPQFALAYVGQADALDAASFSVPGSMAPVKVYREQEAAALKAIALDDSLPQAHAMLAEIYYDNDIRLA